MALGVVGGNFVSRGGTKSWLLESGPLLLLSMIWWMVEEKNQEKEG